MLNSRDRIYLGLVWFTLFTVSIVKWEPAIFEFLMVLLLVAAVYNGYFSKLQLKQFLPLTPVIFLSLFIAANFISLFNSSNMRAALYFLAITLYCIFIWCFFLFLFDRFKLTGFRYTASGYTASGIFSAVIAIAAFFHLIPLCRFFLFRGYRAVALFQDPNVFGAFMVFVVIASLSVIIWRRKSNKLLWAAVFVLAILAVILSFSRAALLNMAVSLIVFFLLYVFNHEQFSAKSLKPLLFGAGVVFFIMFWLFFIGDNPRFEHIFLKRMQFQWYDTQRFDNYLKAFRMAVQNPFGIGPGQAILRLSMDTHNICLKVLLENGILGFIGYMGFLLASLIRSWRLAISKQIHNRSVYIGTTALIMGIAVNALFIDTLHWRHFWILMAVAWTNFYQQPAWMQTAKMAEYQRDSKLNSKLERILMVITKGDLGGAQTHVYDLCRHLKDRIEIEVVIGEQGPLYDQLTALGITVHIVPSLNRAVSFIHDWRALHEITRLIQLTNPDLIATHSSKAGMLGRLAAARAGKPCTFTAHGWAFTEGVSPLKSYIYQLAEKFAAQRTDRIICVSEYDRRLAIQRKVAAEEQLTVIHNGICNSDTLNAEGDLQELRLIMVARFCEQKDHTLLLTAMKSIQTEQAFRLQLAGEGPDFEKCRRLADQLGVAQMIDFLGPRQDVPELLQKADIFVLCSLWEGFPITILEAMQAGLPVICSDVGGCSEAVLDGETGFLIPRGDLASLQQRLTELIENRELRKQMGVAGYTRFKDQFTVDKMVEQTLSVYQEVMEQRAGKF